MSEKQITVGEVRDLINQMAPFETAEDFDNVGLLVGKSDTVVTKILVALDATMNVVQEAVEMGANLIISHHPLFFHSRKNMVEEDPEACIVCEMVRRHISLISAHTNLDKTVYSGSACMARALGLSNIRQDGYLFTGEFDKPIAAEEARKKMEETLKAPVRLYGNEKKMISVLSVAGGAFDEGYLQAKELGAQALLTGEVRHHNAIAACMQDFVLFDGTHYGTEEILVIPLSTSLQKMFSELKYSVRVYPSSAALFADGQN